MDTVFSMVSMKCNGWKAVIFGLLAAFGDFGMNVYGDYLNSRYVRLRLDNVA